MIPGKEDMLINKDYAPLTNENFEVDVLRARMPVLVDCWANWCGFFHRINPIYEELAIAFAEQVKVTRLNVAGSEKLATRYGIRVVPTLLIFENGQIVERIIGHISGQELADKLKAMLSANSPGRRQAA